MAQETARLHGDELRARSARHERARQARLARRASLAQQAQSAPRPERVFAPAYRHPIRRRAGWALIALGLRLASAAGED
jgi:hypothetical protein